jgi:hypothetical protein
VAFGIISKSLVVFCARTGRRILKLKINVRKSQKRDFFMDEND